jgi:hypothetical protein
MNEQIPFATPKITRTRGGKDGIAHEGLYLILCHDAAKCQETLTKGK